jgi:hypothetical protein
VVFSSPASLNPFCLRKLRLVQPSCYLERESAVITDGHHCSGSGMQGVARSGHIG